MILLLLASYAHRTQDPENSVSPQEGKEVRSGYLQIAAEHSDKILAVSILQPISGDEDRSTEDFRLAKSPVGRDQHRLVLLADVRRSESRIDPTPFRAHPERL